MPTAIALNDGTKAHSTGIQRSTAARWRRWRHLVCCLAVTVLAAACSTLPRLHAVPETKDKGSTVLGLRDIRCRGDEPSPVLVRDGIEAYQRELAAFRASGRTGLLPPANYLAISGGGENGAFGAGRLAGWSDSGTRPEFKLVTGISTGALIAPFAFLGPQYDAQLKEVFTRTSGSAVFEARDYLTAFFNGALGSTSPLRRTMARYVAQHMLDAIAGEYRKGRLLFIATTNLDEGRPVIWDVGKIAASGRPGALGLIQDILIASTAIPGAFPPVMIDVGAERHHYQEMHVDGGASAQVFVYPLSTQLQEMARRANIVRSRRVFVIRNARLDPEWAQVNRRTLSILSRSVTSLIQTQGIGDLCRIYVAAQRDKIDFNLASIPPTFNVELPEAFDTRYMNALFSGRLWIRTVGLSLGEDATGIRGPGRGTDSAPNRSGGLND